MLGIHFRLNFLRLPYLLLPGFSMFGLLVLLFRFQYVFGVCNIQFRLLQNSRYSFEIKAPPLSDLIFSGIPYKVKLFDKNCITSFVSEVLQIFTVGHLLNLSTAINICTSPWMFLLCSFPVKSICNSCLGSVSFSNFPKCFFGNWYFKLLPDARQAVQSFTFVSMSFFFSGH